jgi:hypothetical protein
MLDWLNSPAKAPASPAPEMADDSGEARGNPVFPVSRFRDGLPGNAKQAANPHGYAVFPVSRFSRFQNEGGPEKNTETGNAGEKKAGAIPEHLPDLLNAMAAVLDPAEVDELREQARTEPDTVAEVCRLILAAPSFPTAEDVAELDRLILRPTWNPGWPATCRKCTHGPGPSAYRPGPVSGMGTGGGSPSRGRPGGGVVNPSAL